jgi:carboxymethylenebutenolidase
MLNDSPDRDATAMSPMPRASDFHPEVLRLFDQFVHGQIDRRAFIDSAGRYATAAVGGAGLLAALSPKFAQAQKVAPTDARIRTEFIEFDSPSGYGKVRAYVVRPAQAAGPLPVVLVAHENRGLNPHIEDIARRLALDNFIAVAPDALFTLGGYPGNEDKARELFAKLDQAKVREDFIVASRHAQALLDGNGKLGVVGFCFGGGMVNFLATKLGASLNAGVPFYGPVPAADQVSLIKAELQLHYAGNDDRINAGWPGYEAALKAAQVRHEGFVYAKTEHGFNNDTTPRFDDAAAKLAWDRTLAFFNRTLRSA